MTRSFVLRPVPRSLPGCPQYDQDTLGSTGVSLWLQVWGRWSSKCLRYYYPSLILVLPWRTLCQERRIGEESWNQTPHGTSQTNNTTLSLSFKAFRITFKTIHEEWKISGSLPESHPDSLNLSWSIWLNYLVIFFCSGFSWTLIHMETAFFSVATIWDSPRYV